MQDRNVQVNVPVPTHAPRFAISQTLESQPIRQLSSAAIMGTTTDAQRMHVRKGNEKRREGRRKKKKRGKKRGKVEREVRKSCHQRRQLTTSGRPTITNLFFFIAITGDDVESRTEPLSYDRSHSLRVCCFATERQCAQLVIQLRERGLLCPLDCTRVKSRQPHHIRLISSLTFTGNEK